MSASPWLLLLILGCARTPATIREPPQIDGLTLHASYEELKNQTVTLSGIVLSVHKRERDRAVFQWRAFIPGAEYGRTLNALIENRGWHIEPQCREPRGVEAAVSPRAGERQARQRKELEISVVREESPSSIPEVARGLVSAVLPSAQTLRVETGELPTPSRGAAPRTEPSSASPRTPAICEVPPATPPDLALQLASARSALPPRSDPMVILIGRIPNTDLNEDVLDYAVGLTKPLEKSERIRNAPSLEALETELYLHYLKASQSYDWEPINIMEVQFTGVILDPENDGRNMLPLFLKVHDSLRDEWEPVDLTQGDSFWAQFWTDVRRDLPGLMGGVAKRASGI